MPGRFGLAGKLVIPFVTIYMLSMLLLEIAFAFSLNQALINSLEEKSGILVDNVAAILAEPLAIGEYDQLERTLQSVLASDKDLAYAHLLSTDGRVVATTAPELKNQRLTRTDYERKALEFTLRSQRPGESPDIFEVVVPVTNLNVPLGFLRVGVSTNRTASIVTSMAWLIAGVGVVSLLLGVAIYFTLTRRTIVDPIKRLVSLFTRVSQGDLDVQSDFSGQNRDDEVGQLLEATSSMVKYLAEMSAMADALAAGDLTAKVEPRSDLDKFGHAFRKMVEAMMQEMAALQHLLKQIEQSGIQVTGASTELAATSREQEQRISEQAATTTEIMVTVREISATSQELVKTMDVVAASAEEASGLAAEGQGLLSKMQSTMDMTVSASGAITSKLAILNEKASKISGVVTTIGKVADQTNLLSLNAAIEAEKAGEFGRGFGVVATEIRRLADQTALATLDIGRMITEVQAAVSAGVMGMDKFSGEVRQSADAAHAVVDRLGEIILRVQSMNDRFEQVNSGMKSQAESAEQVVDSMRILRDATQHTELSIRSFNGVVASLQEATQGLARAVTRHRPVGERSSGGSGRQSSPPTQA